MVQLANVVCYQYMSITQIVSTTSLTICHILPLQALDATNRPKLKVRNPINVGNSYVCMYTVTPVQYISVRENLLPHYRNLNGDYKAIGFIKGVFVCCINSDAYICRHVGNTLSYHWFSLLCCVDLLGWGRRLWLMWSLVMLVTMLLR